MNMSNMKNMIVLKNLPSNIIEEAIVVLKKNKRIKKYQYIDGQNIENAQKENIKKDKVQNDDSSSLYIVKEAEHLISQCISDLETKSPKWKNNMQKLEKKYKKSLKLNLILGIITAISIIFAII